MKIRTKLTIRYTAVTATVFLILMGMIWFLSENNRKNIFFRDLKKEGITKANLFLQNKVDAATMQSIYLNNSEFIDEVEVAVYDTDFNLLYHDAKEIDRVKETREMIDRIIREKSIEFFEGGYQVVGLLYPFNGRDYVITAAAFDGYGYAKVDALRNILLALWMIGLAILAVVGYFLSRGALSSVSNIVRKVEKITAFNLGERIPVTNGKDELDELAITFNHTLDRLEQSFDAQKMFVSNVSHELRTPMAALIGGLEIALLKERPVDTYRKAIEDALVDADKVVKLSEGLLNLARASYQPEQIKMEEVCLDELLLDARELVLKANNTYKVTLIFDEEADDDAVITVSGNAYLLKTAFVNLMENNCKFSADRTSSVQISFYGEKSILRFSDSGIGIPEEDMGHLFTPFLRGSNRNYAVGNGIGMALVQKIVQLHKGNIRVHSYPGEGTVFVVELPHI
ncbi:MAG: ATP-binding protein [Parabacteroides sp.]|nr:ATP-binding protein [Parabacteroides sp.]